MRSTITVLDFTSAVYLGLRHGSGELAAWESLSSGRPVALERDATADAVSSELAELQGFENATLATSTLHLMWDWFGLLADENASIWMDAGIYEIGRWGIERAAARGVPVRAFPHFASERLDAAFRSARGSRRPVIATDGFCPSCGRFAPLEEYLRLARRHGGLLVVDDTQALGLWGTSPSPRHPYGSGGVGSLRRSECAGPEVVAVASLAKGFGVPLAVISGGRDRIEAFERRSATRVHCSPPSTAVIHGAQHALDVNAVRGNQLRKRLFERVRRFREGLRAVGIHPGRGFFPVQTLRNVTASAAGALHAALTGVGIRTVLQRSRCSRRSGVAFLINANHTMDEIDRTVAGVHRAMNRLGVAPLVAEYGL